MGGVKYRRISRLVAAGLWLATLLAAQSATSIEGQ
jgi:hypothetical protein